MGITLNPNADMKGNNAPKVQQTKTLQTTIDAYKNAPKKKQKPTQSMGYDEQRILRKLMEKYNENYRKMSLDIKINIFQKTAKQLENRIKLLRRLQEEDKDFWNKPEECPIP